MLHFLQFMSKQHPGNAAKRQILASQEGCCFYCGLEFGSSITCGTKTIILALHWDHVIPYAYCRHNKSENFVAACHVCNQIKGSLVFTTIEEAIQYISKAREKRGYAGILAIPKHVYSVPLRQCTNPNCNQKFESKVVAGREKLYCSNHCRWVVWDKAHPRQLKSELEKEQTKI